MLTNVQLTHPVPRKYLELTQDVIIFALTIVLFAAMVMKLFHLCRLMLEGVDFSLVVGDILFILVLLEFFRLLLIYLEEHRVSVETMVEVGVVSTLREVILRGALHVPWQQSLVVCTFMLTLSIVLRYSGIRPGPRQNGARSRSGSEASNPERTAENTGALDNTICIWPASR